VRASSLLVVASSLLLVAWKVLSAEQRHQNNNRALNGNRNKRDDSDPTSVILAPLLTNAASERILPPPSIHPSYPLGTAGVPKESLDQAALEHTRAQHSHDNTAPSYLSQADSWNERPSMVSRQQQLQTPQAVPPPLQSPIVYRYYARQKTRHATAGSVPFLFIGPNVDHWKVTAQQLSARGFNVMVVGPGTSDGTAALPEGPALVGQLLDALRWHQVVLVGCDAEAALAVKAALQLAPERVVGLILCGNLHEAASVMNAPSSPSSSSSSSRSSRSSSSSSDFALDHHLHERLHCPFTIIWNGGAVAEQHSSSDDYSPTTATTSAGADLSTSGGSGSSLTPHRTVIIGGGAAPHRRRPEIFAWVLTRFVEDKIAPPVAPLLPQSRRGGGGDGGEAKHLPPWRDNAEVHLPWRVDEMFNEESFVVFGRVAATAMFYGMCLRVLFYQYDNVREGVDFMASAKRNTVITIKNSVSRLLSLFLLFRRRQRLLWSGEKNAGDLSLEVEDEDAELRIPPTVQKENVDAEKDETTEKKMQESESKEEKEEEEEEDGSEDEEPLEPEPPKKAPMFFLDNVVA